MTGTWKELKTEAIILIPSWGSLLDGAVKGTRASFPQTLESTCGPGSLRALHTLTLPPSCLSWQLPLISCLPGSFFFHSGLKALDADFCSWFHYWREFKMNTLVLRVFVARNHRALDKNYDKVTILCSVSTNLNFPCVPWNYLLYATVGFSSISWQTNLQALPWALHTSHCSVLAAASLFS